MEPEKEFPVIQLFVISMFNLGGKFLTQDS